MWKEDGKGNYIYGDYVLTKVNNAFNDKVTYWISKRGRIRAYYCFTYWSEEDLKKQLKDTGCWISYFEEMSEE